MGQTLNFASRQGDTSPGLSTRYVVMWLCGYLIEEAL